MPVYSLAVLHQVLLFTLYIPSLYELHAVLCHVHYSCGYGLLINALCMLVIKKHLCKDPLHLKSHAPSVRQNNETLCVHVHGMLVAPAGCPHLTPKLALFARMRSCARSTG